MASSSAFITHSSVLSSVFPLHCLPHLTFLGFRNGMYMALSFYFHSPQWEDKLLRSRCLLYSQHCLPAQNVLGTPQALIDMKEREGRDACGLTLTKLEWDWQDGLADKRTCMKAWWSDFSPDRTHVTSQTQWYTSVIPLLLWGARWRRWEGQPEGHRPKSKTLSSGL